MIESHRATPNVKTERATAEVIAHPAADLSSGHSTDPDATQPVATSAAQEDETSKETGLPVDEAARDLALAIAHAADDRKAGDITILQTGDVSYIADYFVIVTGFSNVQVRAIANTIESSVKEQFDRLPLRTEGMSEGRWVLKDYGEVIVHIFMPTDREFYDLEAFWGHAQRIEFVPDARSPVSGMH